jgi:hypothetical protein
MVKWVTLCWCRQRRLAAGPRVSLALAIVC